MSIELKNISKRFGDITAVDNVSLEFGQERIYGLLGNNGAGKTTLLNIITNRLYPSQGQVFIDGQDAADNDRALGKVFLMGEANLFPDDMRVRRAFQLAASFYPSFDRAYAEELAQRFGLNTKKKITSLSTGYGSIFRLILGLASNVPYLLLDEPVLGLDAQHRDMFYKLLLEKYSQKPCTIIISTHLIHEVAPLVEHTIIINRGRILKNEPTEQLLSQVYQVSGPAALVDSYCAGRQTLSISAIGGLKTACLEGKMDMLPEGLEAGGVELQEYFISLMNKEEAK